jgi:hypothetical protein
VSLLTSLSPPEQAAFAAIVLSRICLTHKNDADMARGVLETALKDHPNTMSLWVAAVQLELNRVFFRYSQTVNTHTHCMPAICECVLDSLFSCNTVRAALKERLLCSSAL